ncbi:MAG: DUF2059 domain-containing protein [Muribaculaceae bacterium]|nr:DUF2059 domain-containing protein [Muribaculaceae bacterium]
MKTYLKQLLLVAMLFVTVNATGSNLPQKQSSSGVTKEYIAAVNALLDANNYIKNERESFIVILAQFGIEGPMADRIVDELTKRLPDIMVQIYSNHFTLDEIKQMTKLNQDKVRQKYNTLQLQISKEMMQEMECYISGKTSPLSDITVSSDFEAAMREYFDAEEFDKAFDMMRPIYEQMFGFQNGTLNDYSDVLREIMVRFYSKYFTVSEIRHLTSQANEPCMKKLRQESPDITKESMEEIQKALYDIIQNQLSQ